MRKVGMLIGAAGVAGVLCAAVPAQAASPPGHGYLVAGVGNKEAARQMPCPSYTIQHKTLGWSSQVGPVLCFTKPRGIKGYRVEHEFLDGCSAGYVGPNNATVMRYATYWSGDCVFTVDEGTYVRIWGASSWRNVYKPVTLHWVF